MMRDMSFDSSKQSANGAFALRMTRKCHEHLKVLHSTGKTFLYPNLFTPIQSKSHQQEQNGGEG
jgi:hypothetical protein